MDTLLHIEQITPQLTWHLRRDVLYPGEYMFNMEMEEDNHGWHFGGFMHDKLVAVISLFSKGADFQFRKFAVQADKQGQGVGQALLQYIIGFAKTEGGTRIWCNARDTAVNFYTKAGFTSTGEVFHRNSVNYEILEKSI